MHTHTETWFSYSAWIFAGFTSIPGQFLHSGHQLPWPFRRLYN